MENSNQKLVLCVGVCVIDIIHILNKYPAEDSDTRSNHGRWQRGGNASNNCTVLSQLGMRCEFLGTFSKAEMFTFVVNDLKDNNICIDNCPFYDHAEPPLSSVILCEDSATRTIVHSNPDLPYIAFKDFDKCDLKKYKWIHFEARNPSETIQMINKIKLFNNELSNKDKIIISLDLEKPKLEHLELAKVVDYVFLGKDFATMVLNLKEMKSSVYSLREKMQTKNTIICPWGGSGVAVLDQDNNYFSSSSYPPTKVVDTLGAGDTFCASTIYGLSLGYNLKSSIEFSSRIAGAKVGFYGYNKINEVVKLFKNNLIS